MTYTADGEKRNRPTICKEYIDARKEKNRKRAAWKKRVRRKTRRVGRELLIKDGICPRCMEPLASCGCNREEVLCP